MQFSTIRQSMNIAALAGMFFTLSGVVSLASSAGWTSDPALASYLGPRQSFPGFSICPPKSFIPMAQQGPSGSVGYAWRGAANADGTHGYVMVAVQPMPEAQLSQITAQEVLDSYLQGAASHHKNFAKTQDQFGVVYGTSFYRARWTGDVVLANGTQKMAGFVYATKTKGAVLYMTSEAVIPADGQDLTIAEASALTLQNN